MGGIFHDADWASAFLISLILKFFIMPQRVHNSTISATANRKQKKDPKSSFPPLIKCGNSPEIVV